MKRKILRVQKRHPYGFWRTGKGAELLKSGLAPQKIAEQEHVHLTTVLGAKWRLEHSKPSSTLLSSRKPLRFPEMERLAEIGASVMIELTALSRERDKYLQERDTVFHRLEDARRELKVAIARADKTTLQVAGAVPGD